MDWVYLSEFYLFGLWPNFWYTRDKTCSSKLQSDVCSGGAIWWMLTGWRHTVVDWGGGVFAGCLPRVQLFVSTCNGRPHLALQHHWLLPINCHFDDFKARLVRFPCKTRYIRIPVFSFCFRPSDCHRTALRLTTTTTARNELYEW